MPAKALTIDEPLLDAAVRAEPDCRGCGRPKVEPDLVVCWDCWSQHPKAPFKYFDGELAEWLKHIGRVH